MLAFHLGTCSIAKLIVAEQIAYCICCDSHLPFPCPPDCAARESDWWVSRPCWGPAHRCSYRSAADWYLPPCPAPVVSDRFSPSPWNHPAGPNHSRRPVGNRLIDFRLTLLAASIDCAPICQIEWLAGNYFRQLAVNAIGKLIFIGLLCNNLPFAIALRLLPGQVWLP